jgi:hypothetical protein
MPTGLNRALQVRTADRLRAGLARDELTGLPAVDALSDMDQEEMCEVGGGRLAAVAIRLEPSAVHALALDEVVRLIDEHVRRTDLLAALHAGTLVVLAPGLDPVGGQRLAERLRDLLTNRQADLRVQVGAAYRSAASPQGWTIRALAAEAESHATEALAVESIA